MPLFNPGFGSAFNPNGQLSPTVTINATTYTLGSKDSGKVLVFTSATPVTVTLDRLAAIGTNIEVVQGGVGQITFIVTAGIPPAPPLENAHGQASTFAQAATVALYVRDNPGGGSGINATWVLSGDTV